MGGDSSGDIVCDLVIHLPGSPEMYSSAYPEKFLVELALKITQQSNEGDRVWATIQRMPCF